MSWFAICNLLAFLRHGEVFYLGTTSLQSQFLALGVILATLFAIGGYDRRSDMTSLAYTSEHFIAMAMAMAATLLLIYTVSTYRLSLHPSRAVVLASFALFTPLSLCYRRPFHRAIAVNRRKQVFLVLGAGEIARRFYRSYLKSENLESLRFFEVADGPTGQPSRARDSPVVESNAGVQLDRLGAEVSGVILAEEIGRFHPEVIEHLVRMHFLKDAGLHARILLRNAVAAGARDQHRPGVAAANGFSTRARFAVQPGQAARRTWWPPPWRLPCSVR